MIKIGDYIQNRFEVLEFLGGGKTGLTFKVKDQVTGTFLGLKVIYRNFYQDKETLLALKQNLFKSQMLEHPGLIRIYDIGTYKGLLYYTMEYVDAINLRGLIEYNAAKREEFSSQEVLFIFSNLLKAINYLHLSQPHKNIEPENIFIKEDLIKISGFAESFLINPNRYSFMHEMLSRSPYTAPEILIDGNPNEPKSDIYSLGVILYELFHLLKPKKYKPIKETLSFEVKKILLTTIAKHPVNRTINSETFLKLLTSAYESEEKNFIVNFKDKIEEVKDYQAKHPGPKADYSITELPQNEYWLNLKKIWLNFESFEVGEKDKPKEETKSKADKIADEEKTVLTNEDDLRKKLKIIMESKVNEPKSRTPYYLMTISIFAIVVAGFITYTSLQKKESLSQSKINQLLLNEISEQSRIADELRLKEIAKYKKIYGDSEKFGEVNKFEILEGNPIRIIPLEAKCEEGSIYILNNSLGNYCIDEFEYPNTKNDPPINNITFDEASFFCKLKNKRLCSKEELGNACTKIGQAYSFGEKFILNKCNIKTEGSSLSKSGEFANCVSEFGVYDLNGNLAEWAQDKERSKAYVFGGSFLENPGECTCSSLRLVDKNTKSLAIGFRCCNDEENRAK